MLKENQYSEITRLADEILFSSGLLPARIAIVWLHVIREHPVFLKVYDILYIENKFIFHYRKILRSVRNRASLFKVLVKSILLSPVTQWSQAVQQLSTCDVLFVSHLLNAEQLSQEDDFYFADLAVKGRAVRGNTITKYTIKSVDFKSEGVSTLKPRKIWFDDAVQRLNVDERGELLGEFRAEDKLLVITQSGKVKAVKPDLAMHFEDDMIVLEKWKPNKPISAIYLDADKERYYVKRFLIETPEKEEIFISENSKSRLEIIATDYRPVAEVLYSKRSIGNEIVNFEDFIAVKGIKAQGNQLSIEKIKQVNL